LPEKGNAGPVIKGVRIIKQTPTGPRVIQRPMTCWAIPKEKQRVENSGGVLEIIANEGEKMEVVRALPVDTTVPSQGVVRTWESQTIEIEVPRQKRPHENPLFREQSLAYTAIRDAKAREMAERPGKLLGFKPKPENAKAKKE
jgi:hypothetical protein